MRTVAILIALVLGLPAAPALAQSDEGMQLQRCVWGCLARSSGNQDPAYHECVEKVCVAGETAAPERDQSAPRPDRATVTLVQQSLVDLGFDPGPVDGVYGRKTAAAVQAFRASRGLGNADGIDDGLVASLRSETMTTPSTAHLDVPFVIRPDEQMAGCASSTVTGLDPNGEGFLAVRSGPGTQYRKIDEIHNGDVVRTCDARGPWIAIYYGPSKRTGWVHGRWLKDLAG